MPTDNNWFIILNDLTKLKENHIWVQNMIALVFFFLLHHYYK